MLIFNCFVGKIYSSMGTSQGYYSTFLGTLGSSAEKSGNTGALSRDQFKSVYSVSGKARNSKYFSPLWMTGKCSQRDNMQGGRKKYSSVMGRR